MNSLKYIITKDRDLIKKYTLLVESIYKKDLNVVSYTVNLEELTNPSNCIIMAIKDNGDICGGVTLYKRNRGEQRYLPCEKDTSINLFDIEYSSYQDSIFEISKLVIAEKYRKYSKDILYNFYNLLITETLKNNGKYIYTVSYKVLNKISKLIFNSLGVGYELLSLNIPSAPIYNGIEMQLSMVDLSSLDSSVKEVV